MLEAAAKLLGVNVLAFYDAELAESEWLRLSQPEIAESNVAQAPEVGRVRMIPVVGSVKGGLDGYLEELQYPVGHGDGYVPYWVRDDSAYALRVKGDSMSPRYRSGEFIVVTPAIEAMPSSDVVVRLKDGRKLLKTLSWVRGDTIQLLSVNDGFPPITLTCEEIEGIHRVAGMVPADALSEG